uniref:DUF4283 domain-containing protein n=1 Tax=Tanacetum cinerariifolium TaxID=118510 RepID=A0A6L2KFK7_TANCI|nr:hypothetical protein [Tanacetum cinerariifolium]
MCRALVFDGFLSPKGRGSEKGVKEKSNDQVHAKMTSILNVENSKPGIQVDANTLGADFGNATQADQNMQLDHNLGGPTASISTSQGNKCPITTNNKDHLSFSKMVTGEPSKKIVNFRTCTSRLVIGRYGCVFGVKTRSKYGLVKSMMNSANGLFFFKFSSKDGMYSMLKNGPRYIRKFSEDGLSAIATKLDTPLMLDSYKSAMCTESWGMSIFARTMIELWSDVELKDTIVVDVSKLVVKVDMVPELVGTMKENKMDDEYDPNNDALYDGHDMSENLQAICDDWGIKVRGRTKK